MSEDVPQGQVDRAQLQALSRATGTPIPDLVALNSADDPFHTGSVSDWRHAEWFAGLVNEHGLVGKHLRDVHYALLSLGANYSSAQWRRLGRGSRMARTLGLFGPWDFPDARSRRFLTDGRIGDEPAARLPAVHVPDEPWASAGRWELEPLTFQPLRIVVFCEKDGDFLNEVIRPCEEFGAGLRVTVGLSARTTAGEVVRDTIADGRPTVVLWVSDADSTGEGMPLAMARHLEHIVSRHDAPPIYLDRIVLTLAQVAEIEDEYAVTIPLAPDVRRALGRVEINALPYFAPGWLEERTRAMLGALTSVVDVDTSLEIPELDEQLETLHEEAATLYAPIAERMQEIEQEIDALVTGADVPEFVEPDVDVPDLERDWILDPKRAYLEQLNAYRRHSAAHLDSSPLTLSKRLCPQCGRSMAHRAVQAQYCSDLCRDRARRARTSEATRQPEEE